MRPPKELARCAACGEGLRDGETGSKVCSIYDIILNMEIKDINLDKYEVISFDIFDTLIKRKYFTPKGIFEHISTIIQDPSFTEKRIQAEIKARKISTEQDITIDEIYKQLPHHYINCKEQEKLLEINNSFANREIKDIYLRAIKLNKKVVAASDMYLDKETVIKILNKAGFTHFNNIYISGECKKTKWTGDLFDLIIKDYKISPKKILHIGDNYKSDYLNAQKRNINAYNCSNKDLLKKIKFKKFALKNKELEKSCLYALCNEYYNETNDYFKQLGFTYGGPLCLAFINWVHSQIQSKKDSNILFISRDGWILKKVFDILYPGKFKTHYIYASRDICQNVKPEEYKKYLEKQNIKNNIIIVDTITENYTAQKFLQQFFTQKITALYLRKATRNSLVHALEFEETPKIYWWPFVEFIITAPEYPAQNIKNGQIIFETNNKFENIRKDLYIKISEGILDFINTYLKIYKNEYLKIDNFFAINWANNFLCYLDKSEKNNLSNIYYTSFHNDKQKYFPIVPRRLLLAQIPYIYIHADAFTFEIMLFNKIPVFKRIINPNTNKKIYYLFNIPILRKKYV